MLRMLKESERGAIFRMGRFQRVAGPGLVLLAPLLDLLVVVDLDRAIPQWQEVYQQELDAMVEFLVIQYPEIPSGLSLREIREAMYLDEGSA
jgi:regulator of protease activity HflC (stomatin/prohibitin superfamily)